MTPHKSEINLLPRPAQARRLRRLYAVRAQQQLLALLVALVVAVGLQAGAWWWFAQQLATGDRGAGDGVGSAVAAEVGQANALLQQFDQEQRQITLWTPLVADIVAAVPAGVRITALEGDAAARELTVAGVAQQRGAIVAFQQSLEEAAWVDRLTAPLSNLSIGSTNTFTFILHLPETAL